MTTRFPEKVPTGYSDGLLKALRMNKPKQSKRWQPSERKWAEGMRSHSVPDELAAALGHLIVTFALIEDEYAGLLGRILNIGDGSDRYIFHNLQAGQRTKVLKTILHDSPRAQEAPESFDLVIDEFERLRTLRNAWAHGIWLTNEDGTVTVSKAEPEMHAYLHTFKTVSVAEILAARDDCLYLYADIQRLPAPWKQPAPPKDGGLDSGA